jgi:hypothetical protein
VAPTRLGRHRDLDSWRLCLGHLCRLLL